MTRINLFADWHTHTRLSDGRGSAEDNVRAAAGRGLQEVAITDHGPGALFIGVKSPQIYLDLKEEARRLSWDYSVRVLAGAEANVISQDGALDIPESVLGQLDLVIAGLHFQALAETPGETLGWVVPNNLARVSRSIRERMRNTNTKALQACLHRHRVDIVSHPDLMMAVDVDELARACAGTGAAMEINVGHNYPREPVVLAALKHGAFLAVNSDAHYPATVGDLAYGAALLERFNVPPEQVKNSLH
ncbi:MAG: PHP domain-containing protein [Bacillota bacterium]|jgi:putative hydrolase